MASDHEEYRGGDLTAFRYLLGAERRREIVPGGARAVMGMIRNDPRARGEMLAFAHSAVFGRRHPETGQHEPGVYSRYLDPRSERKTELPVEALVGRLVAGNHVKSAAADGLVNALAAETAGLDGELLIARVEGHWGERSNWGVLVDEPDIPYHERKITRAIEHHRDQLAWGVDAGSIARDSAFAGLAHLSGGALNAEVARRLAMPSRRHLWRYSEFQYDGSSEIYNTRYVEPADRKSVEAEVAAQQATGRYGV